MTIFGAPFALRVLRVSRDSCISLALLLFAEIRDHSQSRIKLTLAQQSGPRNRMWRKTRKPNYGTSCIGTDPNRNWSHKWGGECNWLRSFQLFDSCTTLCKYTHWMPPKSEHVAQCKGIWNHRSGLRTRQSESDSIVRNPRSRHSGVHLCDRNPFFEIRNLITREPNTFFEIRNLPVRIRDPSFGIRN